MNRLTVAVVVAGALSSMAAEFPVAGSSVKYPQVVSETVADKPVNLKLTGAGLRTKAIFSVYAVGSYVQEGAAVRSAEELAKADVPRLLHLVMERTVESGDFIGALKTAMAKSYPPEKFAAEFGQLASAVGNRAAVKGDHVKMLATPGEGVRIRLGTKVDVTVRNPAFAQALWEVYLGPKPIDESLKKSLISLLR